MRCGGRVPGRTLCFVYVTRIPRLSLDQSVRKYHTSYTAITHITAGHLPSPTRHRRWPYVWVKGGAMFGSMVGGRVAAGNDQQEMDLRESQLRSKGGGIRKWSVYSVDRHAREPTMPVGAAGKRSSFLMGRMAQGLSTGRINNLISSDTENLQAICQNFHTCWSAPLRIIIAIAMLYQVSQRIPQPRVLLYLGLCALIYMSTNW